MRLEFPQVTVVHTGEQMMLDLQVQASCKQIYQVVVGGYIMGSENLMYEEVV
jgi:hypothetical protein